MSVVLANIPCASVFTSPTFVFVCQLIPVYFVCGFQGQIRIAESRTAMWNDGAFKMENIQTMIG